MLKPEIKEFAELLMREVRDNAIASCDILLKPEAKSVVALRWHASMKGDSHSELETMMIPDCVDETMFYLLHAIDQGSLRLSFVTKSGATVDLTADGEGELAGWFSGTGGWREEYSKERFIDDFKDLK